MSLLKRQGPLALCFLLGMAFFLQYYIPHPLSQKALTRAADWLIVVGGFTMLLGLWSLFHLHAGKIARQAPGWGFSLVAFAAMLAATAAGLVSKANDLDPDTGLPTPQGWVYQFVLYPLNATMFATLGFYVASAAFRTFRLKSVEAGLLMASALVLLFGRVPLGEYLWSRLWGYDPAQAAASDASMNRITEWIMSVPNMAGRRGILFGITLGALATSLKVILGIERSYLGGEKD